MKWHQKHTSLIVIAIGFFLFYLLFNSLWLLAPIILAALGFVISPFGELIHNGWMTMAKVLGYINSRILLFIIFFIILTPVAFLRKLFGKKTIQDKNKVNSYFQNRSQKYRAVDLLNPW
jgi:hypothetical protein